MNNIKRLLVVSVLATNLYLPFLGARFLYDDVLVIAENGLLRSLRGLWVIFSSPSIDARGVYAGSWRPLSMLSFAANHLVAGGSPWLYRLTNTLLHGGMSVCVFLLLRRILAGFRRADAAAFFASLVFALHPLHSHTILLVWKRTGLLSALFMALGLLAFLSCQGRRRIFGTLGAFVLALLCKEDAVVFPLLLLATLWVPEAVLVRRESYRIVAAAFGLAILYTLVWLLWIRTKGVVPASLAPTLSMGRPTANAFTQTIALWRTFVLMIWPIRLNADHRVLFSSPCPEFFMAALGLGLLGLLTLLGSNRDRRWAVAFLFFLVPMLPFFAAHLSVSMDEARAYFPVVGLSLALALGISSLPDLSAQARKVGVLLAGVFLTFLFVRTELRGWEWMDGVRLWKSSVKQDPGNARALNNLVFALLDEGRNREALPYAQAATMNAPRYDISWLALGRTQDALGDPTAPQSYRRALSLDPKNAEALNNLGAWHADRREWPAAIAAFDQAIQIDPFFRAALKNRALALELQEKERAGL